MNDFALLCISKFKIRASYSCIHLYVSVELLRQASVALNVWQPQIVRGNQKSVVEQCTMPVESRIRTLEMDFKVCKTQISMLRKSYVSFTATYRYIHRRKCSYISGF